MSLRRETAWFVILSLTLSWAVEALWLLDQRRFILLRVLMCVPALVGIACAFVMRREPPRAAGLEFTGFGPWLVAILYPWAFGGAVIALAYLWRFISGQPDFISYAPAPQRGPGPGFLVGAYALLVLVWLLIAVAYRRQWQERIAARLPAPLGPLRHVVRLLFIAPIFFLDPIPGELCEEIGWRGFLVRRWAHRPIVAALVSMPVWAAFHLPLIFSEAQRGQPLANAAFVLSVVTGAVPFAALYLWGRSVWPCALLHLSWNFWLPRVLGNVYSHRPGLFAGQFTIFNHESVFGVLVHTVIVAGIFWYWRRRAALPVPAGDDVPLAAVALAARQNRPA